MRISDWSSDVCSSDLHFFDGVPKIATVEQDDRCGDEVEGSRAGLLVLQATVAKATEPMEGDRSRQAVARLALVQLGGDRAAARRIVDPDRKSVVSGKSVSVRVEHGCRAIIKQK